MGTTTRSLYRSTPSCTLYDSHAGQRFATAGLLLSKLVVPCSISWRMWLRDASVPISRERRDHEIMPSSWAMLRMEANSAYSIASGMLGEPRELQFTEPGGRDALKLHQLRGSSCLVGA